MGLFVEEQDRRQDFLLPASLDDYVADPSTMLKIYLYVSAS